MRKIFLGITIIALCASCKSQHERANQRNNLEEKVNPISDPDLFIGKHKAKAMVLGVFHFDNPGLDSYKPKYSFNILEKKKTRRIGNTSKANC